MTENKIPIRYIYQENQGMHGAHNTAYKDIHTELNTCIDSDDWMPDDAVEIIIKLWNEKKDAKYAGIVGLDYSSKGNLIGSRFPDDMHETTLTGFYDSGGLGDKKQVYRTDVVQKYPEYPRFEGERYFSLG
jgi:glycosyltransferase involved in cell wall biosynthesis